MNDRIEPVLKHERLKTLLWEALRQGEYKPGDQLPSQNEMADRYGVSHNTVREALASLVHDGWLYRIQGRGTFVADKSPDPVNIAVVMPHLYYEAIDDEAISFDIVPRLVSAIEGEARGVGANIMLFLYNRNPRIERTNLQRILQCPVDAAIIFSSSDEQSVPYLVRLSESGIPLVLVDRNVDCLGCDYVGTDNFSGTIQAIDQLAQYGIRDIGYVDHGDQTISVEKSRRAGYLEACERIGIEPRIIMQEVSPWVPDEEIGDRIRASMKQALLEIPSRPFAIFAQNGPVLRWMWLAIEELRIPHDQFALGCFDNPYTPIPDDIRLVRVIQPLDEIGRQCVRIVMKRLGGDTQRCTVEMAPQIRVSTLCPHDLIR